MKYSRILVVDGDGQLTHEAELQPKIARPKLPRWTRVFQMRLATLAADPRVTDRQIRILCYMISQVHRDNLVWLYPSDIAKAVGGNERSIYRALRALKGHGLVHQRKPGCYALDRDVQWQGDAKNWAESAIRV